MVLQVNAAHAVLIRKAWRGLPAENDLTPSLAVNLNFNSCTEPGKENQRDPEAAIVSFSEVFQCMRVDILQSLMMDCPLVSRSTHCRCKSDLQKSTDVSM